MAHVLYRSVCGRMGQFAYRALFTSESGYGARGILDVVIRAQRNAIVTPPQTGPYVVRKPVQPALVSYRRWFTSLSIRWIPVRGRRYPIGSVLLEKISQIGHRAGKAKANFMADWPGGLRACQKRLIVGTIEISLSSTTRLSFDLVSYCIASDLTVIYTNYNL